jgi:hypothetical protein
MLVSLELARGRPQYHNLILFVTKLAANLRLSKSVIRGVLKGTRLLDLRQSRADPWDKEKDKS